MKSPDINRYLTNLFGLSSKTVVLTGATGFLGRYMSEALLSAGARVILMASSDRLDVLTQSLASRFGDDNVIKRKVDFYDLETLKVVLEDISEEYMPDVLINNAYDLSDRTGFNTPKGSLESSDFDIWNNSFIAGIYWAVLTTQIIGNAMLKKGKGSIVNISSMYGLVAPNPKLYKGKNFLNPPSYSVVKSGIIGLTRYTASFWGHKGIRCNAVAPGPFSNTEEETANSVDKNDDFIDRLKERTLLGRIGHPGELVGAIIYLASDASSYMTGQVISIDGGWTVI